MYSNVSCSSEMKLNFDLGDKVSLKRKGMIGVMVIAVTVSWKLVS